MNKTQQKALLKAAGYCINIMTAKPTVSFRPDAMGKADGEIVFAYPLRSAQFGNVVSGGDLMSLANHVTKILGRKTYNFWIGVKDDQFLIWSSVGA